MNFTKYYVSLENNYEYTHHPYEPPIGINVENPKSVFDFIARQLKIEIPKSEYIGFEM